MSEKITLLAGETVYFVGTTNGSSIHFHDYSFDVNEGGVEIHLHGGVTFSGGEARVGLNRNRTNSNGSTFTISAGATVTETGTQLNLIGIPEAVTQQARSAVTGTKGKEWVLAPSTPYALAFTNLDQTDPRTIYADMTWYEA